MILVRADANSQIGVGHAMRCLALAQAWRQVGRRASFLMVSPDPKIITRIEAEGIDVLQSDSQPGSIEDATETITLARHLEASWIVVDGYVFGDDYQRNLQSAGCRVLLFDDLCKMGQYHADVILNQNIHAHLCPYAERVGHAQLLLGLDYVLLRPEFQRYALWQREVAPVARKILVTLGGGDHANISRQVIQALQKLQQYDLKVKVLVGPTNPHRNDLENLVELTAFSLEICEISTRMPEQMAWADMAISAGGSTCWELAFMGLPALILVLADNQRIIAEQLDGAGVAVSLGEQDKLLQTRITTAFWDLQMNPEWRTAMSQQGRRLVDGRGAQRVVTRLLDYENSITSSRS